MYAKNNPLEAAEIINIISNQSGTGCRSFKCTRSVIMYNAFGKNINQTANIIHCKFFFIALFKFKLINNGIAPRKIFHIKKPYIILSE